MHQSSIYLKVTIQFPTIPLSNFIHRVLNDDKFKTKGISNAMSEPYMSGGIISDTSNNPYSSIPAYNTSK